MPPPVTLRDLNSCDQTEFVRICGPLVECSPWIAARTFQRRPFSSIQHLYEQLCRTIYESSPDEQLAMISAHPDLVGRLAREGRLTPESSGEQAAAGLTRLSDAEIAAFERYNAAYRQRFGFPFVICARENRKEAILAAFPVRLQNTREQEIATALAEVTKIARLRLLDRVTEP